MAKTKAKKELAAGSVEGVAAEIAELQAARGEQVKALEAARASEAAAENARDLFLLDAYVGNDTEALAQLDQLAANADAAARQRRDLERLLAKIDAKLVELEEAKAAAEIDAARAANAKDATRAVEIAGRVDEYMRVLVADLQELVGIRHAEYRRSAAVGLPEAQGYLRSNHIGQCVLWCLSDLPLDLPRPLTRAFACPLAEVESARQQGGNGHAADVVFEEDKPPLRWTAEDEQNMRVTPARA